MKLNAELNDEQYEIEIKREGERVFAEIDGREYELEASQPEPNIYLFKHAGEIHQIFVSPLKGLAEPFSVHCAAGDFEIKIFDPKRLRGAGRGFGAGEGAAEIKTAMPGKVVRILTEAGAEVAAGDGILIVEAMKMQNELKAPKAGVVKEIRVSEGATVNAGEVLAIIE